MDSTRSWVSTADSLLLNDSGCGLKSKSRANHGRLGPAGVMGVTEQILEAPSENFRECCEAETFKVVVPAEVFTSKGCRISRCDRMLDAAYRIFSFDETLDGNSGPPTNW